MVPRERIVEKPVDRVKYSSICLRVSKVCDSIVIFRIVEKLVVIERPKIERMEKFVTITREVSHSHPAVMLQLRCPWKLLQTSAGRVSLRPAFFPRPQVAIEKVIERQVVRKVGPPPACLSHGAHRATHPLPRHLPQVTIERIVGEDPHAVIAPRPPGRFYPMPARTRGDQHQDS